MTPIERMRQMQKCNVVHVNLPHGTTCIGQMEHARHNSIQYDRTFRDELLAGQHLCDACFLRHNLPVSLMLRTWKAANGRFVAEAVDPYMNNLSRYHQCSGFTGETAEAAVSEYARHMLVTFFDLKVR